MKYTSILLFGYLLLTVIGCDFKRKYENKKESDDSWSTLIIVSEHRTVITIINGLDTSFVERQNIGSIFTPRPKKVIRDTTKVIFTKAEQDSLFYMAKNIVLYPVLNTRHCTDYVGDLDIYINYGNDIRQGINYSGVCDWTTLSANTLKLHALLKKRMPKVYLGESSSATSRIGN